MNKKLMTSIKIATAVLASAVVICFATPHNVGSDSKTAHGVDFPVQAAIVTTLPETTATVTTRTTTTTSFTSTSTTSTITSTSTTTSETTTTTVVTEDPAALVETTAEPTEVATQPAEPQREIEIINEYIEPTPVAAGIDDSSRRLLAEITWHEAGSSWISQYNKAKIVAGVMNRVNDPRFPNTVYDVLVAPNQFTGYWPGCCEPSQACWDAVDYYFTHTDEFNSDNSWWGDGSQNHFYYQ